MASYTLSYYQTAVQRLLHDKNANFFPLADLTDYINQARGKLVGDTGCIRTLQTIYLSQGVESYIYGGVTGVSITTAGTGYSNSFAVTFTGGGGTGATGTATASGGAIQSVVITNPGSGYTSNPTPVFTAGGGSSGAGTASALLASTLDVWGINVIWGSWRYSLAKKSYSELTAKYRGVVNFQQRPVIFAGYGETTQYLSPVPDQTYTCEFDTITTPVDLANLSDVDTIPYPFVLAVPYYAAYLAKHYEQSYEEANMFEKEYKRQIMEARVAKALRVISNPYTIGV